MKKKLLLTALIAFVGASIAMAACPTGCECAKCVAPKAEKKTVLCKGCGEVKGSAKCCKADAEKCSKCGMNKGAPGCCADKPKTSCGTHGCSK